MGVFNLYTFNNVDSASQFLTNLKNVAENEGWTIDNFDVSRLPTNPGYLYLHSSGNGNQNLYYSMAISPAVSGFYLRNFTNLFILNIFGNTGYNSGQSYNNQPGKWTLFPDFQSGTPYGHPVQLSVITQYIFANSSQILMFCDSLHNYEYYSSYSWRTFNERVVMGLCFGSIDSYKSNDTNGNFLFVDGFVSSDYLGLYYQSGIFGMDGNTTQANSNVYYFDTVKVSNSNQTNLGLSITFVYRKSTSSEWLNPDATKPVTQRSFQYWRALTFNDFTNKGILIKPIIFIKHTIGGYNYFFPIGELPYYASVHYPYYTAGQEVTYGQRKFVAMPVQLHTYTYGLMIEVNPE